MNKERLMNVLIQPHVSEKSATIAEKANQYVFRVLGDASKDEVKQAVELMFEVRGQQERICSTSLASRGASRMSRDGATATS